MVRDLPHKKVHHYFRLLVFFVIADFVRYKLSQKLDKPFPCPVKSVIILCVYGSSEPDDPCYCYSVEDYFRLRDLFFMDASPNLSLYTV